MKTALVSVVRVVVLVIVVAIGLVAASGAAMGQTNAAPASSAPSAPVQSNPASKPDAPKADSSKADPSRHESSSQDYSKEALVIERLSTKITEEDDGTGAREVTAEVKMLAEAGVKAFAVLSFIYTSANEAVDFDYVRVRKPDGTVVKTPDYNIQDMPGEVTRTAPLYSDIHEKHVAVKGLGVGDTLEYLVRYRVLKPEVPGHFWFEYSFNKVSAVRDEQLEISVPSAKYVKVVSPEFKPVVAEEGTRRVYRWTHTHLEVKEKDPDELPRRIPPNPDVQMTTFASWDDVGRWYGGLQKDPVAVTPVIQAKAAELTKGLKTDDEKIRALYTFVSLKYHYIGLDFGIGRYQPHAADDVLDNGYGDCKDKHTLLASLLKAEGYDAWPALIHASRKLDPDVPSPAQFNHVITVVSQGGQNTWLDTTPEVAPYGLLMLQLRDKQALVIPTNKAAVLMTTPANPPTPGRQEFSMEGKLDSEGTFTGHAKQSYEGDVGVMLRAAFRQVSESQWKDLVQRFSHGLNFQGDVSEVKVSPPDEIDKPFEISYDYVRKNYGDWENHHTGPPLPLMGLEVVKDAKDRKPPEPIVLGELGKVTYHARVQLPAGYDAVAPAPVHLLEPYAEYTDNTKIEKGVMTTTRELIIKKNEVPLNDWEEYRKFGIALSDDEFGYITLLGGGNLVVLGKKDGDKDNGNKTGSADVDSVFREAYEAAQNHDLQRAKEKYEQVIALDPKYPMAHLNLGGVLLTQGNVPEARAEWRKEQEVNPKDVRAYQVPAISLTYMHLNDEAIQEWRSLLKIDPENRTAAASLGGLLYGAGKYSEAVEILETAVKAAPDSPGLQMQLGSAYLKTGQKEKAISHMQSAAEQDGKLSANPMMLNDVAYALAEGNAAPDLARRYAEEAVKKLEASSIIETAAADSGARTTAQLSMAWDTLGWVYFQSGDTNRAESFVRAAWLLGQRAIVGEHLGEIYEKQGKRNEAANTYQLALAAEGSVPVRVTGVPGHYSVVPSSSLVDSSHTLDGEITARYQKLTGKKPELRTTVRLPNGEWTKTPGEQLTQMRTVKFGKLPNLSGSAEFTIVFSPGRVERVEYASGENSLKDLTEKIKAAHYQVEFPEGSQARILRRADVGCFPASGCMAVLAPPSNVAQLPGQY